MILPAVLETDPKIQIQRMGELSKYSNIIHVDIMDGEFVRKNNLGVFSNLCRVGAGRDLPLLELHLMVQKPAKLFSEVRKIKKVKRIVLQIEGDWESALKKYKQHYQVGLSFKLETPILDISTYRPPKADPHRAENIDISFIHLFAITPGAQGNPFRPEVYKKVKEVRKLFPKVPIEIDGAMNPTRIRKLKRLGANDFVVGSFLKSGDVENKMKKLNQMSSQTRFARLARPKSRQGIQKAKRKTKRT